MSIKKTDFFLGVDGGGTRTRILLCDSLGSLVAYKQVGASNPNSVGWDKALSNLKNGIKTVLKSITEENIKIFAFLGISGVNDKTAAIQLKSELEKDLFFKDICFQVENDTRALCSSAFYNEDGIVIIAGTGSKCYGRNKGLEWETGGYDFLISDEGSAFDIAKRGMIAATYSCDGRGPKTILEKMFFDTLKLNSVGEISQRIHQNSLVNPGKAMKKDEIAELAMIVSEAYRLGDKVAQKIYKDAMSDLVQMVGVVAQKIEMNPIRVATTGGVLINEPGKGLFEKLFLKKYRGEISYPKISPVKGAVLSAYQMKKNKIRKELLKKIVQLELPI